jgi:hypothetical protein
MRKKMSCLAFDRLVDILCSLKFPVVKTTSSDWLPHLRVNGPPYSSVGLSVIQPLILSSIQWEQGS